MEKENIITVNQTHKDTDFNWAIKRYLPSFNDGKSTIIGVQFPWKKLFEEENSFSNISQNITNLFNEFTKSNFFENIKYSPQHRDVFLFKIKQFSSYYWIEFIFAKNKWNLKVKGYSWEDKNFIHSQGINRNDNFIISKIGHEISSETYDIKKWLINFDKRKFKLPIYTNKENFENSNYIFHLALSDGMRRDFRLRSINLLIDEDFDYFLHINSNEYSEISGKEINYIQQGQAPKNLVFQLLEIISENKEYQTYGRYLTDLPQCHFMFKINNKMYDSRILAILDDECSDLRRLENLKKTITEWVDNIIEFQKQN